MSEVETEQLAIIKGVGIGMRDCSQPILWFHTMIEHSGALQVLNWERAGELLRAAGVYEAKGLEGKACIIAVSPGAMVFKRLAKI